MSTNLKHRKLNRLTGYDYSRDGYYFVTVCVKDRENLLGEIRDGRMVLNQRGRIVLNCWRDLPRHYPNLGSDEFIVMPNHVHGIIIINNVVGNGFKPFPRNYMGYRNLSVRSKRSHPGTSIRPLRGTNGSDGRNRSTTILFVTIGTWPAPGNISRATPQNGMKTLTIKFFQFDVPNWDIKQGRMERFETVPYIFALRD